MTEYSNIKGEMTECHGQNKYTRRKKKKSKNRIWKIFCMMILIIITVVFLEAGILYAVNKRKQNNDSSFCEKISIMINRRWSKTLI